MNRFFVVLVLAVFILGCEGKQGPVGPSGSMGSSGANTFDIYFQNGALPTSAYSGELDTWLSGASGSPQNATPYLEVNSGAAIANYARTILKFDVSNLPTNTTIVSAQVWLKLEAATSVGSSPITIGLHDFASDTFSGCHWTSNATWLGTPGVGWNSCTGDSSAGQEGYINPTTISTVVLTSAVNGTSSFYKWNLDPAIVQSWLTSATNNNGLILKSEGEFGETASTVGFYPYNDATAANHPILIVSYY